MPLNAPCRVDELAPQTEAAQLEAWATRRLRGEGLVRPEARIWSRHSSAIALFDVENVEEVIDYVLFQQGAPLT